MSVRAGMLHTVPALSGTFDNAFTSIAPRIDLIHLCDPWLLDTAIARGITATVRHRVRAHVLHLAAVGSSAILVSCSSIGEVAEEAARLVEIPVLRVDAPMATQAVQDAERLGIGSGRPGRITVLATLEATLGPTGRLIQRAIDHSGTRVEVSTNVVKGAVHAKNSGRYEDYDRLITDAVHQAKATGDVVVLAQASMANVITDPELSMSVLTSPRSGIASFVSTLNQIVENR